MMGNCKDCKWWVQHDYNLPREDKRRKADELEGYGECKASTEIEIDGKVPFSNFSPEYGSEPIFTLPTFGCVLFEQREA